MELLNEQNKFGLLKTLQTIVNGTIETVRDGSRRFEGSGSGSGSRRFETVRRQFQGFEVLLYRSGGLICAERSIYLSFNWYAEKQNTKPKL